MTVTEKYILVVRKFLPSPLTIAILLTVITAILAAVFATPSDGESLTWFIASAWEKGLWDLLQFAMQMMIMLVLGHSIALTPSVSGFINRLATQCKSPKQAALYVAVFSVLAGYLNWGLGLIFGAILARKVAENLGSRNIKVNFGLLGACGYLSLLVWHGGLSGTAPLTVSTPGHSLESTIGIIPINETLFSARNIFSLVSLLIVLPVMAFLLAGSQNQNQLIRGTISPEINPDIQTEFAAERLDHSRFPGIILGSVILILALGEMFSSGNLLSYFQLNTVNFLLLGIAFIGHGSIHAFTEAAEEAIKGTTGILIQFPLYAGIMGIMKYTGLLTVFADWFVSFSTADTFPFFAYFSSALVNILVPSGGGQWQLQGPILMDAAKSLGVDYSRIIMALSYGDELTNMLQPFWALPLLGITGLKARDILPWSTLFMLAAGTIYLISLYLF
ncbi:MAG: short-chain fatty acid transporter [Bacteroidetes bacterium]|nr:short-chain fatty acid transporter [Bacteroidota bacterium]